MYIDLVLALYKKEIFFADIFSGTDTFELGSKSFYFSQKETKCCRKNISDNLQTIF